MSTERGEQLRNQRQADGRIARSNGPHWRQNVRQETEKGKKNCS